MHLSKFYILILCCLSLCLCRNSLAQQKDLGNPALGYRLLTEKTYLPPYFDQETFDNLWQVWPKHLKEKAENASLEERRLMAYQRYGLTPRPNDPLNRPLQYVVGKNQNWTLNCFACHGGQVEGKTIPGLPNSTFAMHTLTEDVRRTKIKLGKKLVPTDYSSLIIPLGNTNGTTNAVVFGVALFALRDKDLNLKSSSKLPTLLHHDLEAPPWWHFKRKKYIYLDGFASKGHRGLMQFMLVRQNGPEKFREWEDDFKNVYAYLESIESPKYQKPINEKLAAQGKIAFENHCSECHGTYGKESSYPEVTVPIDEIGTDKARFDSLQSEHYRLWGESWFNHYGEKQQTNNSPSGYVAPPLDGIWASAPYLHNGSVPTLWHLLHPNKRPKVWRRQPYGYDHQKMGLQVQSFDQLPKQVTSSDEKRTYFDSSKFGKSNKGHDYPDRLTENEKQGVLEYLKTL